MEHISATVESMKAKVAKWADEAAVREAEALRIHQERMATLPPGTCEKCYGTKRMQRGDRFEPCPDCDPPILFAVGTPFEFRDCQLSNYEERSGNHAALEKAREFVVLPSRDLYLHGGVGAGKSRLACSIANEWYRRRGGAMFARVPMVLRLLQPSGDAEEVAGLEHRLFTTPLLVLDDIGAERDQATDYTRRTLLMIYEERGDRGLRTVFTSNKSIQELSEMQDDDRLASRIAGRADVVRLTTSDQRLAGRRR